MPDPTGKNAPHSQQRTPYTSQLTKPYSSLLRSALAASLAIGDRYETALQQRNNGMLVIINRNEAEADFHNLKLLVTRLLERAEILKDSVLDMDQSHLVENREFDSFADAIASMAVSPRN